MHILRSKLQSSKWFKDVQSQRTRRSFYWNNEQRKKNIIVECIYEHPKLPIEEFHYQFFSPILEKFSFKSKNIYLLGDFNVNLLNFESDRHTAHFLVIMYSNSITLLSPLPL